MLHYIWLIPFMPLMAALACGVAGRRLGHHAGTLATAGMATTFALTLRFLFSDVAVLREMDQLPFRTVLFPWMEVAGVTVNMGFLVDQVTMIMLLIVSGIGTLVFYFAQGYMHDDPGLPRFFSYLSLFAFSMYLLVLGDNLLLTFVGWEGVGLCSYLLIGFWFHKTEYAAAGRKAFIANRVGDVGFLLATFFCLRAFGTVDYTTLKDMVGQAEMTAIGGLMTGITLCLLLAATGKSAQIPLYVWLPDAMAGPTPVSALIHAATMVTAGIYLVVRMNFMFALAPVTLVLMAIVGAMTAIGAALIACTQNDIKKVLAYSTISQLGYMFLALGVGAFSAALFHVFTHAFFKACLFLGAGAVIHAAHHEQDMRKLGGLRDKMPITSATYFISVLAIAGVFPLSGFFSKDEILWNVFGQLNLVSLLLWPVALITAALTAFYMGRSYFMTFEGKWRGDHHTWSHVHEVGPQMTRPLIILAFGAVITGVLGMPAWLVGGGHGHGDTGMSLIFHHFMAPVAPTVYADSTSHSHALEIFAALVSLSIAGLGLWFAYKTYGTPKPVGDRIIEQYPALKPLYARAAAKFSVDELYDRTVLSSVRQAAHHVTESDRDRIDGTWSVMTAIAGAFAKSLKAMQTGNTQTYAAAMLLGLNLIVLLYLIA